MSSYAIMLIPFAIALILVPALFVLYCWLSSSDNKFAKIFLSVFSKVFSVVFAIIILFTFGSYLHSCSAEEYDRGYEDGYDAGIEEGIFRVREDPSAYLN